MKNSSIFKTIRILTITTALQVVVVAQFSPKAPKVAPGCVVPYQKTFVEINPRMWTMRAAQVWCESNFNPRAKSSVARGLAQFTNGAWKSWGVKGKTPLDPYASLISQNKYMGYLEIQCDNNLNAATASYNCGLENVIRAQNLARRLRLPGQEAWLRTLPRITGRHSRETINYITNNKKKRKVIQDLLNQKRGKK